MCILVKYAIYVYMHTRGTIEMKSADTNEMNALGTREMNVLNTGKVNALSLLGSFPILLHI